MNRPAAKLSTAEIRREAVISSAISVFAKTGYQGTPITSVAEHAGISPAYVFKLFPGKTSLFVAAIERCYERIERALASGAERAASDDSDAVLHAMGDAYARLIVNRELLMLQVHAQSASDDPDIAEAVRKGIERLTTFAQRRSGGGGEQVQRFIAFGQLCHLVTTLDLVDRNEDWARVLTDGIRHHTNEGRR